jgi:hypothetical protein
MDNLVGMILQARYMIVKRVHTDGAQAVLYLAKDQLTGQTVIAKVTQDQEVNYLEHSILHALNVRG